MRISQVQRRAARWTASNFDTQSSVTTWMAIFEAKKSDGRLCLFYKVIHGLVTVPLPDYIHYSNGISRYFHSMTFRQVSTSTDYYKLSFFPLAIVQWNSLPESVACLQSLDAFKATVCNTLSQKCYKLRHKPYRFQLLSTLTFNLSSYFDPKHILPSKHHKQSVCQI